MSNSPANCPGCGADLPANAPQGLCPRCLLKAGLGDLEGRHLHIRCPHCQHAIELVDEQPTLDLICPACDTGFSLAGEATATFTGGRPLSVGRFQLIERLGAGAFGAVWKAHDPELDRLVAVKIPRKGQLAPSELEQFLREARSSAQLRHPHIVAVHEVGRNDDTVFIVSEFVDGITLADRLTSDRPGIEESSALVAKIARALAHAHAAGVVHRDLKPSNIMLDSAGEPHVMDFGLAKRTAGEVTMTMEGQVLGTPAYMSPEQAQGEGRHADGRSDVYSLGVVLFELLTGEKPFRGNMRMLLHQVIHDDPPSPRRLNARTPRDLETIVLKCLEKDPRRRYATASELADDLNRATRGEPIQARPISRVERTWRWCRRNPLPAALAGLLGLVVGGAFLIVTTAWLDAREQRRLAQNSARLAELRAAESRSRLVRHFVEEGGSAIRDGEPTRAAVWFAEALLQDADDPTSNRTDMHRRRLSMLDRQLPRLVGGLFRDGQIPEAHFSPDARRITFFHGQWLEIIDAVSGRTLGEPCGLQHPVRQAFFSPQGRYVAAIALPANPPADGDYDGQLVVLNAETGQVLFAPLSLPALAGGLGCFTPDGERLFVVADGAIHCFQAATGERTLPPIPVRDVRGLVISPHGRRLLVWRHVLESLSEVLLFDAVNGQPVGAALPGEQIDPDAIPGQVFSPDGERFATFCYDFTGGRGSGPSRLQLWNSATAEPAHSPIATTINVAHTFFSLDGSIVYAHLRDESVSGWCVADGRSVELPIHFQDRVERFAMSPDGLHFAVIKHQAGRSSLTVFDAWNRFASTLHEEPISKSADQLEFSPDGQRLLVSSRGAEASRGRFHIIDLASRDMATVSVDRQFGALRAEFSADGDQLLTSGDNGVLQVWDLKQLGANLSVLSEMDGHDVSCLQVSPNGRSLAVGQGPSDIAVDRGGSKPDGRLRVWDLASRQPVGPELRFESRVTQIAFASDSRTALATLSHGAAVLVDVASGRRLRVIQPSHDERVGAAALLPDGRIVVYIVKWQSQGEYLNERGLRLETWPNSPGDRPVSTVDLNEHELFVFSPAGDRYLLVNKERDASICDSVTGRPRTTLGRLHGQPETAVFRADGDRIAIVYGNRVVEQWDTVAGRLAAPLIRNVHNVLGSPHSDGAPIRYSADGRLLLVRLDEHRTQLLDATRAEPLSLPIATQRLIGSSVHDVLPVFGLDANSLYCTADHSLRTWQIGSEARDAENWSVWSRLVDSHQIDAVAGYAPLEPTALRQHWGAQRRWRVGESDEQRKELSSLQHDWHRNSARLMEMAANQEPTGSATAAGRWYSAQFHLDRLVAAAPADAVLRKRRAQAVTARISSIPPSRLSSFPPNIMRQLEQSISDAAFAIEGGLANDPQVWFDRGVARQLLAPQHLDAAVQDVARAIELGFAYDRLELHAWQKRASILGLTRRLDREPNQRRLLLGRGELAWEVRDWQTGLESFSQLIAQQPAELGHYARRGDCYAGLGRWREAVEDYSRALDDSPPDARILSSRAGALAIVGRYDEATADLVLARQSGSYPFDFLLQESLVRLLANDLPGYQQVCRLTLSRAHELYSKDDLMARVPAQAAATIVQTCSLGPGAVDDYTPLIEMAEKAIVTGWYDDPDGSRTKLALAGILYRANRSARSLEYLTEVSGRTETSCEQLLLRAMVLQQLGQSNAANAALAEARAAQSLHPDSWPWTTTATLRVLRREAEELVKP